MWRSGRGIRPTAWRSSSGTARSWASTAWKTARGASPVQQGQRRQNAVRHPESGGLDESIRAGRGAKEIAQGGCYRDSPRRRRRHRHGCLVEKGQARPGPGVVQSRAGRGRAGGHHQPPAGSVRHHRIPGLGCRLLHDLPVQVWPHARGMGESLRLQPRHGARGDRLPREGDSDRITAGKSRSCAAIRRKCSR